MVRWERTLQKPTKNCAAYGNCGALGTHPTKTVVRWERTLRKLRCVGNALRKLWRVRNAPYKNCGALGTHPTNNCGALGTHYGNCGALGTHPTKTVVRWERTLRVEHLLQAEQPFTGLAGWFGCRDREDGHLQGGG